MDIENDRPYYENLAERAVKSPSWRWMTGMKLTDGRRIVGHTEDGRELLFCTNNQIGCFGALSESECLPDLTDYPTLGCLLYLVREVWGDERAYLCDFGGYDSVEWGVVSHEWDEKRQADGPKAWFSCLLGDASTEAGALVVALESAP